MFAGFISLLNLFASAGGGGSGGGGGGGSGGGGGGIYALFFVAGYAPMHLVGRKFRLTHENAKKGDREWWDGHQILAWIIGAICGGVWLILTFAVGFGVHSFLFGSLFFAAAVGAFVGVAGGLYNLFGKLKRNKVESAELAKSGWDETALTEGAKRVFLAYQRDWSNNDTAPMRGYMTDHYFAHAQLMIAALKQMNRRNDMANVQIAEALITSVDDEPDNSRDNFVIGFTANARDRLVDATTGQVLANDPPQFTEFWKFDRDGTSWKLDGIQPATADRWSRNPSLEAFASANGFYYSLDWGWLLLPRRGQLFASGAFGKSDINNHCIGYVKTAYDQILTQIYTYSPNPQSSNTYLIAQATLPRSYGDIVVRRRRGAFQFAIRHLKKISTEWNDFNAMFQVFATSPEQATSLELLTPSYMDALAKAPFEINIEVVDNVLYLYAPLKAFANQTAASAMFQTDAFAQNYQMMLWALGAAFKEMKM